MPEETSLLTLPEIVTRPEQAYAYIPFTVSHGPDADPADKGFPRLFSALAAGHRDPFGAFLQLSAHQYGRYARYRGRRRCATTGRDADGVTFGTLPAGRYATLKWHGHFDALEPVTAMLIGWVRQTGQALRHERGRGRGSFRLSARNLRNRSERRTRRRMNWVTTPGVQAGGLSRSMA